MVEKKYQNHALIKNVIMDLTLLYTEKKKKFSCPPKLLAYFPPSTEFLSVHKPLVKITGFYMT